MMYTIAEPMISWSEQSKTCIDSSQRHRVQQQDHSRIWLMEAVEGDSEDEVMEEALHEEKALEEEKVLAMVVDQLLVTSAEL